ncbi:hypothetical protein ACJX0J_002326, partial [Zea mays]
GTYQNMENYNGTDMINPLEYMHSSSTNNMTSRPPVSGSCTALVNSNQMQTIARRLSSAGFRGCSSSLRYLEAESCMLSPDGLLDIASGSGLKYLNLQKLRSSTGL